MPPKTRITRESVLNTALDIVRRGGISALNARTVAAELGCSTQPIFSCFATMEELKLAVVTEAMKCFQMCMQKEAESGRYPPYKAAGMAYIRFAREERELFKLLYMRERSVESLSPEAGLFDQMVFMVQGNTGLTDTQASLFHLESWAFVHGVATMIATGYLELEEDLVSKMLTDAYQGLKKHYEGGV